MGKTLLIDGDSICYICSKGSLEESIDAVDSCLKSIFKATDAEEYIIFLSKGPYFRHVINPEYKGQRKASSLLWLKTLKMYLVEKYHATTPPEIEADDAVAYYKVLMPDAVICAIDKDVLKQVPGKHYNYMTRKWVTTTEEEAYKWLYLQALMGDSGDNIKGLPGIGPAKAAKILDGCAPDNYKYRVLQQYTNLHGDTLGIMEFYKTFFQVYLLRTKEEIELFVTELPLVEPVKIVTEEKEEW